MSAELEKQLAAERERADYAWRNAAAIDSHYMAADKKQRAEIERLQKTLKAECREHMDAIVRMLDREFEAKRLRELLLRAMAQLDQWHEKYGEHNPEWLPPAGDVQLAEDVSDALVTANAIGHGRAACGASPAPTGCASNGKSE